MTGPLARCIASVVAGVALVACGEEPTLPRSDDRLTLSRSGDSVFYGRSLQLSVTWPDSIGVIPRGEVTWSTSDTLVAVVDTGGAVLGTGPGVAEVTARYRDVFGRATVRVVMRRADGGVEFDRAGHSQLFSHGCALTLAGQPYCLRPVAGDTTPVYAPVPRSEQMQFVEVGTGFGSACGLVVGGQLYCWGSNGDWLLGTRIPVNSDTAPLPVQTALRFSTAHVSGHTYVCAVSMADDVVHCWGHGHSNVLGRNSDERNAPGADSVVMPVRGSVRARSVSGGNETVCALDPDGTPWCWGSQSRRWSHTSPEVTDAMTPARMAGGLTFAQLAVGDGFACGLDADGRAYCIGGNGEGQLGIGTTQPQPDAPVPVAGDLRFRRLWAFSAGPSNFAACGITHGDDLYCWGSFAPSAIASRLGAARYRPTRIAPGVKFQALSVGQGGWCAVTRERAIVCW